MPINQGFFENVKRIFVDTVFVIPTFQRPYSWNIDQFSDLRQDIQHAATTTGEHYLSPLHVIKITDPKQSVWQDYTDRNNNTDLLDFESSAFCSDDGSIQEVFLVVDGQQRLTTLFLLFISKFGLGAGTLLTKQRRNIPRIILNPANDHFHLCQMIGLTTVTPSAKSRSQDRLTQVFNSCQNSVFTNNETNVLQNGLKTLLVELSAQYGLRGFLTLNDRGKRLTDFEKLKSLLMEFDLLFGQNAKPKIIHDAFGDGYAALDATYIPVRPAKTGSKSKSLSSDDQLLAILSIDVWRLAAILNEGADSHFSRFRASKATPINVADWMDKLTKFANEIVDLTGNINGNNRFSSLPYDPTINRTVHDHYRVICDSLSLTIRSLAFALKFRSLYKIEMHDRRYDYSIDNTEVIKIIQSEINDLVGEISFDTSLEESARLELGASISALNSSLMSQPTDAARKLSVLDLAEWIELFIVQMGSQKDYVGTWDAAFDGLKTDVASFQDWAWCATNFHKRASFFRFLASREAGSKRKIVSHVLAEYESALRKTGSGTSLVHSESHDVEHFLPGGSTAGIPSFSWCGIADRNEYDNICNTLGNLLLLDKSLNRAFQDQVPSVKLKAYKSGHFANTTATVITQQSIYFSDNVKLDSTLKHILRMRGLEVLIFAMNRF